MTVNSALHRCHRNRWMKSLVVLLLAQFVIVVITAAEELKSFENEANRLDKRGMDTKAPDYCGGVYTKTHGQISSPNYPVVYPNNAHCVYRISASLGKSIWLQFKILELEQSKDCESDSVKIYHKINKTEELLETMCGFSSNLPAIQTNSSDLSIVFKSDGIGNAPGFKAEYFIYDLEEWKMEEKKTYTICDDSQVAMAMSGEVLSHTSYPSNSYPGYAVCRILIPSNDRFDSVKIEFFDVKLKLYSTETTCKEEGEKITIEKTVHREKSIICKNNWEKVSILSEGSPLLLTFHTTNHNQSTYRGFKAIYTQYYSDTKYGESTCKSGDFHCKSKRLCIPGPTVCDGYNHCGDYEDERKCDEIPSADEICNPEEFYCGEYGKPRSPCIYREYAYCDGYSDCANGSDEEDCPNISAVVSGETVVGVLIGIILVGFVLAMIAMFIYKRVEKMKERKTRMKKAEAKEHPAPTPV
ncbi:tolloid-like protein 1 [Glandiceps talaboti]